MANIYLKVDRLEKLQSELSLSDSALAQKIGMDFTSLWRIKTGRNNPGEVFIAKLLAAFPETKFEDLFFIDNMSHGIQANTGTDG